MKTVTMTEASLTLGKLADEAIEGEEVLIQHRGQLVILKKAGPSTPTELLDPDALVRYYKDQADNEFEERICSQSADYTLGD
jgi:hypothetical protein